MHMDDEVLAQTSAQGGWLMKGYRYRSVGSLGRCSGVFCRTDLRLQTLGDTSRNSLAFPNACNHSSSGIRTYHLWERWMLCAAEVALTSRWCYANLHATDVAGATLCVGAAAAAASSIAAPCASVARGTHTGVCA